MHDAFRRGGRKAIDAVMKQQPAVFLKLLVLLVPREMQIEQSNTLKAMSDEQLEQAVVAIQAMLDRKAKVIEAVPEPAMPALPVPIKRKRTHFKPKRIADPVPSIDADMGKEPEGENSSAISKVGDG